MLSKELDRAGVSMSIRQRRRNTSRSGMFYLDTAVDLVSVSLEEAFGNLSGTRSLSAQEDRGDFLKKKEGRS